MKRIFLGLAAGLLGLALTGTADAHDRGHGGHPHRAYYHGHGRAFAGGYYYAGHSHPHWGPRVWDVAHHRYHYWDPDLRCYYYWYPARACWYPVTYCP